MGEWDNIGLIVCPDDHPEYLVIDEVSGPSLIHSWNVKAPVEMQVVGGRRQRIVSVNGFAGNSDAMMHKITTCAKGAVLCLDIAANAVDASIGPSREGTCS